MGDPTSVQRALDAFPDAWRVFAAQDTAPEIDGVLIVATGGQAAFCNQAIVYAEPAVPRAAFEQTIAFFDERSLPFLLQVPAGSSVNELAFSSGLTIAGVPPFMVLDPIEGSRWRPAPAGLEIRPVVNDDEVTRVETLVSVTFGMDPEAVRSFGLGRLLDAKAAQMFLGWIDGEAVTTSSVVWTDGVAGIFSVGTLEEQRGKSLGEVMTAHAILTAADAGADIAYLQASDMGYPIYERMGFRTVTSHTMYARATAN
jgi:hypothetical protein